MKKLENFYNWRNNGKAWNFPFRHGDFIRIQHFRTLARVCFIFIGIGAFSSDTAFSSVKKSAVGLAVN
jgi:hypothetical protein